tara:strand:+ start:367 stop:555 length:189 start_codon:yes stop_codon:yes gene_type:complete
MFLLCGIFSKQYLPLSGDDTMLQEAILCLNGLDDLADPIIICNTDYHFLVKEHGFIAPNFSD